MYWLHWSCNYLLRLLLYIPATPSLYTTPYYPPQPHTHTHPPTPTPFHRPQPPPLPPPHCIKPHAQVFFSPFKDLQLTGYAGRVLYTIKIVRYNLDSICIYISLTYHRRLIKIIFPYLVYCPIVYMHPFNCMQHPTRHLLVMAPTLSLQLDDAVNNPKS